MRRPFLALCAAAILGFLSTSVAAPAQTAHESEGVLWVHSVEQALTMARDTGEPILAYVTSEHCGYCRKMERDTWSSPRIAAAVNEAFVPLELDSARDRAVVQQLGVTAFPTTLVIHPSGRVVQGAAGYLAPDKTVALLRAGLATAARPAGPEQVSQPLH